MICRICKDRESEKNKEMCSCCRLKKWRRDNPEKVKAYYEMRKIRDKDKIMEYRKIANNDYYFGGNRIKVLERDNYTCQVCGAKKSDGNKIIVHHKDRTGWGKKKPEKNNGMDNLITLCQPCHVRIHKPYNNRKKHSSFLKTTEDQKDD